MIKAIAFDLGNTLVSSPFPLSWQGFYREAITTFLRSIELDVNDNGLSNGESILAKYNTRINPRDYEIDYNLVFREMFDAFGIKDRSRIKEAQDKFAFFFLSELIPFPESIPMLRKLRNKSLKTGILTNVAYGMGKEYFSKETRALSNFCDVFLTSVDVGFRKPNPIGYNELARRLAVNTSDCIFVGDEEVDITGANKSGMISVLVDRESHNPKCGQIYTIKSLEDLLLLIDK